MSARWERRAGRAGWRFVPAPGWPPPPAGWSPSPGWRPDPAWPTPPGWRWMRRKRLPVALLAAGAIGCVLLFVAEIATEATGHSLDPTDPMNYNFYSLRNDSASELYVHLCADPKCLRLDGHFDWVAVRPGTTDEEQVACGDSTPAVYAVSSTSDGTGSKRCLALDASEKARAEVDLPLSSAGRCGG